MKDWNQCSDEIGRKLGWLPLNSPSTQVPLSFAEKVAELYAKEVAIEAVKLARHGEFKDVPIVIDQYGGTNIEQHFVTKYTKEEILEKLGL